MRITYDRSADAAYIYITDTIEDAELVRAYPCDPREVNGQITLGFDAEGRLRGIDVLDASRLLRKETLDQAEIIG